MYEQEGYPVRKGCTLLNLPYSSYYHLPMQADECAVERAIEEVAGQFPT